MSTVECLNCACAVAAVYSGSIPPPLLRSALFCSALAGSVMLLLLLLPGIVPPTAASRGTSSRCRELLKVSRPSIRLLGDSAAGALQPLLLGQEGRRFRFADDCPLPLSWCGCVATAPASPSAGKSAEGSKASTATVKSSAGPGMDDVRAFIASAVERR